MAELHEWVHDIIADVEWEVVNTIGASYGSDPNSRGPVGKDNFLASLKGDAP